MTTFSDNFNRADNTSLGSPWSEVAGDWSIVSNQLRAADSASAAVLVYDSALATDNNQAQVTVATLGNVGQSIGVFCRGDSTFQNAYYGRITTTAIQIFKVVSGTLTGLGSNTSTTISAGAVVKVQASGSNISAWVNGVQIISLTDTAVTTGKRTGLRISAGAPANPVRFDDFAAADLPQTFAVSGTAAVVVGTTGSPKLTRPASGAAAVVIGSAGAPVRDRPVSGLVPVLVGTTGAPALTGDIAGIAPITVGTAGAVVRHQLVPDRDLVGSLALEPDPYAFALAPERATVALDPDRYSFRLEDT